MTTRAEMSALTSVAKTLARRRF